MSTTFATLLRTTHTLRSLSNDQLAVWIAFFLENCKSTDGAKFIIDGVFKTLYQQGDDNVDFINQLLKKSQELKESATKKDTNNATTPNNDDVSAQQKKQEKQRKKVNYFEGVPDALLCEIGSYLRISELFYKWNRVCHQFFQISIKSETIQHWNFPQRYDDSDIADHAYGMGCEHDWHMWTNFDFNLKLFHLQSMIFTRQGSEMGLMPQFNIMKMPKNVEIVNESGIPYFKSFDKRDGNDNDDNDDNNEDELECEIEKISLVGIRFDSEYVRDRMEKIFPRHCNNMKEVKIVDYFARKECCEDSEEHDFVLQRIIPQSPLNYQIHTRIKNEISDDMRYREYSCEQIEEMEDKIKKQVEMEYNEKHTLNENDLNMVESENTNKSKNTNKNQKEWHSKIESLVFEHSTLDLLDVEWSIHSYEYVEWQLNENRIKSALPLLESLVIRSVSERDGTFCTAAYSILNTIGNQILSLHIGCKIYSIYQWKFLLKLRELEQKQQEKQKATEKEKEKQQETEDKAVENATGDSFDDSGDNDELSDFDPKWLEQPWYPLKIEYLCLSALEGGGFLAPNIENKVNSRVFPSLKHLRYRFSIKNSDKNKNLMNNLHSLINNGLESLHLVIDKLKGEHFLPRGSRCGKNGAVFHNINYNINKNKQENWSLNKFLNDLSNIFKARNDNDDNANNRSKNNINDKFIFKLECFVDCNVKLSKEQVKKMINETRKLNTGITANEEKTKMTDSLNKDKETNSKENEKPTEKEKGKESVNEKEKKTEKTKDNCNDEKEFEPKDYVKQLINEKFGDNDKFLSFEKDLSKLDECMNEIFNCHMIGLKINFEIKEDFCEEDVYGYQLQDRAWDRMRNIHHSDEGLFEDDFDSKTEITNTSANFVRYKKRDDYDYATYVVYCALLAIIIGKKKTKVNVDDKLGTEWFDMAYCQPKHKYYCCDCQPKEWVSCPDRYGYDPDEDGEESECTRHHDSDSDSQQD